MQDRLAPTGPGPASCRRPARSSPAR